MRPFERLEVARTRWAELAALLMLLILVVLHISVQSALAGLYTVNSIGDAGPGTLRDGINWANFIFGSDTIDFNIPGVGPYTIQPLSPLPPLLDPSGLVIDGLTQPGASSGANPPTTAVLMIELYGASAGLAHGFHILSSFNTIQGIVIDTFEQDGIRIEGTIDGTSQNYIYCNFIGTDPTGTTVRGNGYNMRAYWAGVDMIVTPNPSPTIVFDNIVHANLISGNYAEGVSMSNCPPGDVFGNVAINNYIGTDITGMVDLGNVHDGVYIGEGAHDNSVDGNLISGNDFEGVAIVGYPDNLIYTSSNYVFQNTIGLTIALTPLPNTMQGVSIGVYGNLYWGGFATDNEVGPGNIIAHNGLNGVLVWEHSANATNADGNLITMNSIYDNTSLGIDLADDGVTPNDPADLDAGPNEELNFPVITSAGFSGGQTTIRGTIDIDTNPTQAVVEVFRARPDPSNYGEGELYLGSANPDAVGNWSVTVTGLVTGDSVTATSTDMNDNSSEFSGLLLVVGVEEEQERGKIQSAELLQNEPNPFHGWTVIAYALRVAGAVTLKVYDTTGRLVETLMDEEQKAGVHRVEWSPKQASSGIYFYRLETGQFTDVKKMTLLR